jgi:hypothetical protein
MDYINSLKEYIDTNLFVYLIIYSKKSPFIYKYNYTPFRYGGPFKYLYNIKTIDVTIDVEAIEFIEGEMYYFDRIEDRVCVDTIILDDFVFNIQVISCWGGEKEVRLVATHYSEVAVQKIIRYWRKYRWNYRRNFAAWKYHPSKIDFKIN